MSLDQHMFGYEPLFHRFDSQKAPSLGGTACHLDAVGVVSQGLAMNIKTPSMPALPAGIVRFALQLPNCGLVHAEGQAAPHGCHHESSSPSTHQIPLITAFQQNLLSAFCDAFSQPCYLLFMIISSKQLSASFHILQCFSANVGRVLDRRTGISSPVLPPHPSR